MKGLRRNLPFPTVKNKNNSYLIMLKNNDKVSKKGFFQRILDDMYYFMHLKIVVTKSDNYNFDMQAMI